MGSEAVERIPAGTRFALRTEPGYVLTVVEDDGERIVCAATMEGRQKPDRYGEGLRRHILEDFDRLPPQAPEKPVAAAPPVPEKRAPVCESEDGHADGCKGSSAIKRIVTKDGAALFLSDACYLDGELTYAKWQRKRDKETPTSQPLPRDSWQPQASRQGTCWRTRGGRR